MPCPTAPPPGDAGPPPCRVLVVDDHPTVRLGLVRLLNADPAFTLAAEAGSGQAALQAYAQHQPDLVTLDLNMPDMDGRETLQALRARWPAARVVIFTLHDDEEDVFACMQQGALAYVLKCAPLETLQRALHAAARGEKHLPPALARLVATRAASPALTPRETRVLQELRLGHSNLAIGRSLQMAQGTVKSHVSVILSKLCAGSRTEAVTLAYRRGLLR